MKAMHERLRPLDAQDGEDMAMAEESPVESPDGSRPTGAENATRQRFLNILLTFWDTFGKLVGAAGGLGRSWGRNGAGE